MNVRKIILEHFRAQKNVPFQWGADDCLLGFAAPVAEAITGRDPASHLRGHYNSKASLDQVMMEHGWMDAGDVAASMFPEIPVSQTRAGDWAYVYQPDNGYEGIGVVIGEMIAVKTLSGMGQVPLAQALRAFRVVKE